MKTRNILIIMLSLVFVLSMAALSGCEEPEEVVEEPEEEPEEEVEVEEPEDPEYEIDLIVGFAAGGSNDLTARYLARYMAEEHEITINVVNMPGGMSTEAAYHVSQEVDPEDNILFWGHSGPLLFEPAQDYRGYTIEDFEPVATFCAPTFVLGARPGAPWEDDFEAMVQYIEDNPGEIVFGGQGEGNVRHYAVEQILPPDELDYEFVGLEGGADVAMNLTGEHVDAGHLSLAAASPLVADGELWAVANTNPLVERTPLMEDVPNVEEFGIPEGQEPHPIGMWALPGTDPDLVSALESAMEDLSGHPELLEEFDEMGVVVHFLDSEETWDFFMNVNDTVVPDYIDWLEEKGYN